MRPWMFSTWLMVPQLLVIRTTPMKDNAVVTAKEDPNCFSPFYLPYKAYVSHLFFEISTFSYV